MPSYTIDVRMVPFDRIKVVEGFNLRDPNDREGINELAASIHNEGLREPLKLAGNWTKGPLELVRGHRRYAAISILRGMDDSQFTEVPALVVASRDLDDRQRLSDVIADFQSRKLEGLPLARGIKRMRDDFSMDDDAIAKALGITKMHLSNLDLLREAPQPIVEAVEEGVIAPTEAVRVIREEGPERAQVMFEAAREVAKEFGKGERVTEKVVREVQKDPAVRAKADRVAPKPKGRVSRKAKEALRAPTYDPPLVRMVQRFHAKYAKTAPAPMKRDLDAMLVEAGGKPPAKRGTGTRPVARGRKAA